MPSAASATEFEGGFDLAELRLAEGTPQLAWESAFVCVGDRDRAIALFNGGGSLNHRIDEVEGQLLYEYDLGEGFALRAGARYFFRPHPHDLSAVAALEAGLAPGLASELIVYLDDRGHATGEANLFLGREIHPNLTADIRLETAWSLQAIPDEGTGAGFGEAVLSARLRYTANARITPYLGLIYSRALGDSADIARQAGEKVGSAQLLLGASIAF